MKYATVFASMLGVMMLSYIVGTHYYTAKAHEKAFNEVYLNKIVDYATKAAFQSALEGGDLGISYTDLENVKIDPVNTISTFKDIMALSFDMSLSEENLDMLDNYLLGGVFITSNGYYVLDMHPETKNGVQTNELKWGLKKPYSIEYTGGSRVAYDLSSEKWTLLKPSGGTNFMMYTGEKHNALFQDHGIVANRADIMNTVNRKITNDVNAVMVRRNSSFNNDALKNYLYLPSMEATTGGANPVLKPSLLIAVGGVDFLGSQKLSYRTVGGYTLAKRVRVIGFDQGGVRYYAFEGQIPNDVLGRATNFFNSTEEAAKAGFKPHLEYISQAK